MSTNNCCYKCVYIRRGYDGIPDADLPCIGKRCECHKATTHQHWYEGVDERCACGAYLKATTKESWEEGFLEQGAELIEADLLAMIPTVKKILASERTALRERIEKKELYNGWKPETQDYAHTTGYNNAIKEVLALLDSGTN
jgi:hypothetical protein